MEILDARGLDNRVSTVNLDAFMSHEQSKTVLSKHEHIQLIRYNQIKIRKYSLHINQSKPSFKLLCNALVMRYCST